MMLPFKKTFSLSAQMVLSILLKLKTSRSTVIFVKHLVPPRHQLLTMMMTILPFPSDLRLPPVSPRSQNQLNHQPHLHLTLKIIVLRTIHPHRHSRHLTHQLPPRNRTTQSSHAVPPGIDALLTDSYLMLPPPFSTIPLAIYLIWLCVTAFISPFGTIPTHSSTLPTLKIGTPLP